MAWTHHFQQGGKTPLSCFAFWELSSWGAWSSSEPRAECSTTMTDQENANNSPAAFSTAIKYTTPRVILFWTFRNKTLTSLLFFHLCIFVQLALWIFACTFPVCHAFVSKGFSPSPSTILGFQVGTSWGYPRQWRAPLTSERGRATQNLGGSWGSLQRGKQRERSSLSLEHWDQNRDPTHLPGCSAGLVSPGLAPSEHFSRAKVMGADTEYCGFN